MSLSVIINTIAAMGDGPVSWHGVPHRQRAYALRNFIIPRYVADPCVDEVIVVGTWEAGDGYRYIHVPNVHKNINDLLLQRQAGYETAQSDVLLFQADDHVFDETLADAERLVEEQQADVLCPTRFTRLRTSDGEQLNNGANEYISPHGAFYHRVVLDGCPWAAVPPAEHSLDVQHSKQVIAAGYTVAWPDEGLRIWDVEYEGTPWK